VKARWISLVLLLAGALTASGQWVPEADDSGITFQVDPAVETHFRHLGVTFPPGSFVTYDGGTGHLIVHNTPENCRRIQAIIDDTNQEPEVVRCTVTALALPDPAAALAAFRPEGGGQPEGAPMVYGPAEFAELTRYLRALPDARTLASGSVLTLSGTTAILTQETARPREKYDDQTLVGFQLEALPTVGYPRGGQPAPIDVEVQARLEMPSPQAPRAGAGGRVVVTKAITSKLVLTSGAGAVLYAAQAPRRANGSALHLAAGVVVLLSTDAFPLKTALTSGWKVP
jgi:hypothetical protein